MYADTYSFCKKLHLRCLTRLWIHPWYGFLWTFFVKQVKLLFFGTSNSLSLSEEFCPVCISHIHTEHGDLIVFTPWNHSWGIEKQISVFSPNRGGQGPEKQVFRHFSHAGLDFISSAYFGLRNECVNNLEICWPETFYLRLLVSVLYMALLLVNNEYQLR